MGDIPIYQATKFALVVSLKAAKAIGLTLRHRYSRGPTR